ncbi:MAG TPA: hypothetical protein VLA37_07130 [Sphingomonadaceae bacterium]|nr:hypothetical protein [Sphingomonadaceae bacterium]
MGKLEERLAEDRALRNSARTVFRKELDFVRREVTPKALGERAGVRIGEQVDRASDGAIELAERHGGKAAALIGAIAAGFGVWLARRPILAQFSALFSKGEAASGDMERTEELPEQDSDNE